MDRTQRVFRVRSSFPQLLNPFDLLYKGKEGWLTREFLGQSEDAFYLNVFVPVTEAKDLPVIVWFHGGNLNSGSSNFPIYDPSEFVRHQSQSNDPCIVVTVNYRLGIFGFLCTDDLVKVNGHVGNFGLYDCIKALEWTRQNIALFSGDPDNVTAMGESAGAYIVGTLLHSWRRLFQRAIMQSGSHAAMAFRREPYFPPYEKLLTLLNIDSALEPKARVAALTAVSMEELRRAAGQVFIPDIWGIAADPMEPGWATSVWGQLARGAYDPWIRSIMVSVNEDEGTFFCNRAKWWEEVSLRSLFESRGLELDDDTFSGFRRLYSENDLLEDKSNLKDIAATRFLHDSVFTVPIYQLVQSVGRVPNMYSSQHMDLYVCHFNCMPSRLLEGWEHLGVVHTAEIGLVFNTAALWSYQEHCEDAKAARAVGKCWASFATRGNPGWQKCNFETGDAVSFGEGGTMTAFNIHEYRREPRDFFYPIVAAMITKGDAE